MKSDWMNSFSKEKPEEFVQTTDTEWEQNVDIHEGTNTYEDPEGHIITEEGYVYKTRILDKKGYDELMNTLYTPAHEKIESNQVAGDDNQTAIMEALTEIYEMLLTGGKS